VLTIVRAPIFIAAFNFSASMSHATMFFTPLARSTAIPAMPTPPQPMTATRSDGASCGSFWVALYAVTPEHASVAANESSMPEESTRYFGSGTTIWEAYAPGRVTPGMRRPETQ
jgi:hypothetical protein